MVVYKNKHKKLYNISNNFHGGGDNLKIGLIDVDGHNFPNLPLMKISAYHKSLGDDVEWFFPLNRYDRVYMSKVFDFTLDYEFCIQADEIIKGGTGYDLKNKLPQEIESMFPDYSLYNTKTAYGFLTRGCPRGCEFCVVAEKEGKCSRKVADLSSFWNGQKEISFNRTTVELKLLRRKSEVKTSQIGLFFSEDFFLLTPPSQLYHNINS